jgi:hypothetical protein
MAISGQRVSDEVIDRIQAEVEADPGLSRRALSRRLCGWMGWVSPNGKLQEMGARKVLLELARRGRLRLPHSTTVYAFQRPSGAAVWLPEVATVSCALSALGEVEVLLVSSRYSDASRAWKEMMAAFHPRGAGPLCGAQLRYVVRSATWGWLGALSFSAATWRLRERDQWIGWSDAARRAHLHQVVNNSRFLLVPSVQVPHLASHVLSRCLRRLPQDWEERYGYAPVLAETFVDGAHHAGTSYRAANWTPVGVTAGRATPYANGKVSSGPKQIYVCALQPDWQAVLCAAPQVPLGAAGAVADPVDWAAAEFGRVAFHDARLTQRLLRLARDFFAHPGALVPAACDGVKARVKGAYRFLANQQVDLQTLLRPHIEATVERLAGQDVVLAVQDTTTLNYTAHAATDMGPIHTTQNEATGLLLHDTLAFTLAGVPLGLLDVQCWARQGELQGESRRHRPIEEKESSKWLHSYTAVAQAQRLAPHTTLVSVGDREADLFELFDVARQTPSGPQLLVRAERWRQRQTEEALLWDHLAATPVAGYVTLALPRQGSRPARQAQLALQHARVQLQPPKDKKLPPVTLWAVYATEVDAAPEVSAPLQWMLLTTAPVHSLADASERLRWYTLRWGIEVFHRTLKSGCRIEDRQLDTADRIEACLAIDLVVAWRIYLLNKQARQTPDVPCDHYLSPDEWQALYVCVHRRPPPAQPMSLRQAIRMIAQLGGFLGRKGDGEPGTMTLWRGLQRLADLTLGFTAARHAYLERPP